MNTLKLIALSIIAILFASCKASQPTGPPSGGSTPMLLPVVQILDTTQTMFLRYADSTNGNPWQAMELTVIWLSGQPNVQLAYSLDSTYITIILNSGLETYFSFDQVNDSGYSMFRGGRGGGKLELLSSNPATNEITNKNVLLFEAGTGSGLNLEPQIASTTNRINSSGLGLNVTVLRGPQCSTGVVGTFQNYGLVILDTHGTFDGFCIGSSFDLSSTPLTEDGLKSYFDAQVGAGTSSDLSSGNLILGAKVQANPSKPNWQKLLASVKTGVVFYPSTRLAQLPQMPNTIIFGNMCNSGWTQSPVISTWQHGGWVDTAMTQNPLGLAFINKGLISYYAYGWDVPAGVSGRVNDDFASAMEDTLVRRLMNGDSTGIANLASDNVTELFDPREKPLPQFVSGKFIFQHYASSNYSYVPCGDTLIDPRDGQKYPTVCVGNQVWMAKNLNYDASGSECYDSASSNCTVYGKLYDWNTLMHGAASTTANPSGVQGVCPKGWHVPSNSEFQQLFSFLGSNAASAMEDNSSGLWTNLKSGCYER